MKRRENCTFNTRYPDRLMLPNTRTELFSKNTHVMAIKIYNKLSKNIKNLPLNIFKSNLRKWLTQNCFYTLQEYFNNS